MHFANLSFANLPPLGRAMAPNPERREKAREIARVVRKLRGSDDLVRLVIVTAKDPTAPVPPLTEKVVICDDREQLFRAMHDVRSAYPQVPELLNLLHWHQMNKD